VYADWIIRLTFPLSSDSRTFLPLASCKPAKGPGFANLHSISDMVRFFKP
jgi:hypothetical protein